jgi:hypothetical protein
MSFSDGLMSRRNGELLSIHLDASNLYDLFSLS